MVFPIGPVRSAPYEIDYSLDLNGSNEYLSRRPTAAGSERIGTYRLLVKRGRINRQQQLVHVRRISGGHAIDICFAGNNRLNVSCEVNNRSILRRITTQTFTSISAWYDICIQIDGNQRDDSCCKVEVNGKEITSFNTKLNLSNPTNLNLFNASQSMRFGQHTGGLQYFDGLISGDTLIVDGTNYDAAKFGETKNGVWRPKRIRGINYGTNGVRFDFADSSNLGNDVSGNDNDFTRHNIDATNQSTDTPTSS